MSPVDKDPSSEHPEGNVRTARAAGPTPISTAGPDGFDPFAKLFQPDGTLDGDYAQKRIPTLVEILRKHPACFALRIDHEELGQRLLEPDADDMRSATDQDAFELALAHFSRDHLHQLIGEELPEMGRRTLMVVAEDTRLNRRRRVAAALGVTFLSNPPDSHGLVGRAFFDLVLRVSLEELHAQEQMRQSALETEGGLPAEELQEFWQTYPALRYAYEQRYRRAVTHVLEQIEAANFPLGISVDLALRGAYQLRSAAAAAREQGQEFDHAAAQKALREPFEGDVLLEGGADIVTGRWRRAAESVKGSSKDRRGYVRSVESAIRLVDDGGPGGDAILFYTYLQSIVEGQFHIEEAEESHAARGVFTDDGVVAEGVLAYADYHESRGRLGPVHRLINAAIEIWPEHEHVRARATALAEVQMAVARELRHGPCYPDDEDEVPADAAEE